MPRRMSCSLTKDAVVDRTKTVTRRHVNTWRTLKAGDRLTLIEKGMGLPKGASQLVLAEVEVVSVRDELLIDMTTLDCAAEGFPEMRADDFIDFWLESHGMQGHDVMVRRIEWDYLDKLEATGQLTIEDA